LRALHSGIAVPNEYVAEYVRQHPEKLIGFASVDPLCDDVPGAVVHAVEELKLRGVKLEPVYQNVHPTGGPLMAVYEFCQARDLSVMMHQAATFPRAAPLKYALPILLEEVGLQFPGLKLVIAHLGDPWIAETVVLIRRQPDFSADISALHYRPWQFYTEGLIPSPTLKYLGLE
jgi:predicted TIM-barrel fold metal-dependent hydrolase